jgi:fructokinase
MNLDVITLGEILIDMFPAEVGRSMNEVSAFIPKPGGAPANVAVAAARLGARSAFVGKVGEDIFGHFLKSTLEAEGVHTGGMRFDPNARTTLVFIALPDEHSAEFVFYRNPGADMLLRAEELDVDLFKGARSFHFGSISLIAEPSRSATLEAVRLARRSGALVSFDFNYRPSLWESSGQACKRALAVIPSVDLVKVNETELALLTGLDDLERAAKSLLQLGPALCVVTLGQKGSYYQIETAGEFVPGFSVKTVDATGCGDAFVAGLLTRLVKSRLMHEDLSPEGLYQALRYANAVGALTALNLGVIPALPRSGQVEVFMEKEAKNV